MYLVYSVIIGNSYSQGIIRKRFIIFCTYAFSTLADRVLKINIFVTHLGVQRLIIQTVSKNKLIRKNAYKGNFDQIDESRWREIFLQILCSKPQEYWMYFKVLISKSWGKGFARCRWRFIQRFPGLGKCRPCRMTLHGTAQNHPFALWAHLSPQTSKSDLVRMLKTSRHIISL